MANRDTFVAPIGLARDSLAVPVLEFGLRDKRCGQQALSPQNAGKPHAAVGPAPQGKPSKPSSRVGARGAP